MGKNNFPDNAKVISAADVAKNLKSTAEVFDKKDDTTVAEATTEAKDAVREETQKEALATAVKENPAGEIKSDPVVRTGVERSVDAVKRHLENYRREAIGSKAKVEALQRVVETILRAPKKAVLDEVLAFFVKHRSEPFMDPLNALQNITMLDKSMNLKVRVLYQLMVDMANGVASRKTIALDLLRNIFTSDDFVNWVAIKISKR